MIKKNLLKKLIKKRNKILKKYKKKKKIEREREFFKGIYDISFGQSGQLTKNADVTNGRGSTCLILKCVRSKCRYTKSQGYVKLTLNINYLHKRKMLSIFCFLYFKFCFFINNKYYFSIFHIDNSYTLQK